MPNDFFYRTKVVKIQGIDEEMLGLFWQVEARAQWLITG